MAVFLTGCEQQEAVTERPPPVQSAAQMELEDGGRAAVSMSIAPEELTDEDIQLLVHEPDEDRLPHLTMRNEGDVMLYTFPSLTLHRWSEGEWVPVQSERPIPAVVWDLAPGDERTFAFPPVRSTFEPPEAVVTPHPSPGGEDVILPGFELLDPGWYRITKWAEFGPESESTRLTVHTLLHIRE